jgi:hypothetical protein
MQSVDQPAAGTVSRGGINNELLSRSCQKVNSPPEDNVLEDQFPSRMIVHKLVQWIQLEQFGGPRCYLLSSGKSFFRKASKSWLACVGMSLEFVVGLIDVDTNPEPSPELDPNLPL